MIARHWWWVSAPLLLAGSAQAGAATFAVPGFWQLEAYYDASGGVATATGALVAALPPGTPAAFAQRALEDAGAGCKPVKHESGTLKCLVHQYSLADGAADDIRWTILVHAPAGIVTGLGVNRYVDRHGSN